MTVVDNRECYIFFIPFILDDNLAARKIDGIFQPIAEAIKYAGVSWKNRFFANRLTLFDNNIDAEFAKRFRNFF